MKARISVWVFLVAGLFGLAAKIFSCGPSFPNSLLLGGDGSVLAAPFSDFGREMAVLGLIKPGVEPEPDPVAATIKADLEDLKMALSKGGGTNSAEILQTYSKWRKAFMSQAERRTKDADTEEPEAGAPAEPSVETPAIPDGLPEEFALYLAGAAAWHAGHLEEARKSWEELMRLPWQSRLCKSTWAAFMIAKSWESDPAKMKEHFAMVRDLQANGYADSLGLARSSWGWEAQMELRRKRHKEAIHLYLRQGNLASALLSLQFAAQKALEDSECDLAELAKDPECRKVLTAHLISAARGRDSEERTSAVSRWIEAVEQGEVTEVETAERLALAAYQSGDMDLAERWIKKAERSPTARWLEAKLCLHKGNVEEAALLMREVSRLFPQDEAAKDRPPTRLEQTLTVGNDSDTAAAHVLGELGVLRLARREYAEALDALTRGNFWPDAAFVAERVMTLNELKEYVDSHPVEDSGLRSKAGESAKEPGGADDASGESREPASHTIYDGGMGLKAGEKVRYLLARKLTRMSRGEEAKPYYPKEMLATHARFMDLLARANDEDRPKEERASSFVEAARLARVQGMELMGSELDPDWFILDGQFDWDLTPENRLESAKGQELAPTPDERARTKAPNVTVPRRFHYRYVAAELGWNAALLMPNNSDETARVLCECGSWIKYLDPPMADRFYKALVRRCRKTPVGAKADQLRWFPLLDENGNLREKAKEAADPEPPAL